MFDTLTDSWYVWLGLTVVAAVTVGVAVGLPTVPPPDAESAAGTIDGVAGRTAPTSATHRVTASRIRIDRDRLTLRNDAGVAHASFAFGPVLAVGDGPLAAVAGGAVVTSVFESRAAFDEAITAARQTAAVWRVGSRLLIRHVSWGGEDVTLVAVR
ncbi:MAG: hypothetical protein ABEI99_03480 [Halobaculum sp.]